LSPAAQVWTRRTKRCLPDPASGPANARAFTACSAAMRTADRGGLRPPSTPGLACRASRRRRDSVVRRSRAGAGHSGVEGRGVQGSQGTRAGRGTPRPPDTVAPAELSSSAPDRHRTASFPRRPACRAVVEARSYAPARRSPNWRGVCSRGCARNRADRRGSPRHDRVARCAHHHHRSASERRCGR